MTARPHRNPTRMSGGEKLKSALVSPGLKYSQRASISLMHISTTCGMSVFCALTSVVRSTPNMRFTYFMSGMQSLGTFSEHFLCALKPQSANKTTKHVTQTLYTHVTQKLFTRGASHQNGVTVKAEDTLVTEHFPCALKPHSLPRQNHQRVSAEKSAF